MYTRFINRNIKCRCQRILSGVHFDATNLFGSDCVRNDQNPSCIPAKTETPDVLLHKALHSWAYPQSSLPSSIVSVLSLSSSRAGLLIRFYV